MSELQIVETLTGETTVLRLIGSAGITNADHLQREIRRVAELAPPRLVLDASQLVFISSVAISEILTIAKTLKERGAIVRIAGASKEITMVLVKTRVSSIIPVFATVDDAMAAN